MRSVYSGAGAKRIINCRRKAFAKDLVSLSGRRRTQSLVPRPGLLFSGGRSQVLHAAHSDISQEWMRKASCARSNISGAGLAVPAGRSVGPPPLGDSLEKARRGLKFQIQNVRESRRPMVVNMFPVYVLAKGRPLVKGLGVGRGLAVIYRRVFTPLSVIPVEFWIVP
ncbi:uncharacterized protein LY79DRAFT_239289 [Colletotrichum navitas]|uniref:Uncharacterized protein n=1 Tax=Colletotrichum navitas TaxID=681940 RepID=A0AAD8PX76_9PEZI|nr:uncharacterized protein LY79DRAFT_239289 [Colletotrichum navitas]KAK1589730.1 hypothetical protein LY79DRAFT_239289 [Colletotrichum navitas]